MFYDHELPPSRQFKNSSSCEQFREFINKELISRLQSGAISYLGPVGKVKPPHVVSPLTVEPSKPRLCVNMRYINCFMKDTPFSLDTLTDVPTSMSKDAWLTKLDDKSGYDHVLMTDSSKEFLGFQWGGHYFCCNSLPFGWKNSAYVYHTLNFFISGLTYIDDRLIEGYKGPITYHDDNPSVRAHVAIRYAIKTLVGLGYFLNLTKSIIKPTQRLTFLGLEIDTCACSFYVPEKRKQKLKMLRSEILSKDRVHVKLIQKFCGLCISMVLAIPGAKLYTAACNRALANAVLSNLTYIPVNCSLRVEIEYWAFLDSWNEPFPWIPQRHCTISISTDSSNYKWGAVVKTNHKDITFGDYWTELDTGKDIMIKEALALYKTLLSIQNEVKDTRICALVDNLAVVGAWKNQYAKNEELNDILKLIFNVLLENNCLLYISYIPSACNIADEPSRKFTKSDASITYRAWAYVDALFGPHTVDMFALDSNAVTDVSGTQLKHYTQFPTPNSAGVDAFAQDYTRSERYYAFPPFCLIPALIKFIVEEKFRCTVVFPDFSPCPSWFPFLVDNSEQIIVIGFKGDRGVLRYPSKHGFISDKRGLPWNLLCASFTGEHRDINVPKYPLPSYVPVIIVGDSMVRFLQGYSGTTNVISVGGATLLDSLETVKRVLSQFDTSLLIFHSGTNNISRLVTKDDDRLMEIKECMSFVLCNLKNLQKNRHFAVIISACIYVGNAIASENIRKLNAFTASQCQTHHFRFVKHDNITGSDLRDYVHLNGSGEEKFISNLDGYL